MNFSLKKCSSCKQLKSNKLDIELIEKYNIKDLLQGRVNGII